MLFIIHEKLVAIDKLIYFTEINIVWPPLIHNIHESI